MAKKTPMSDEDAKKLEGYLWHVWNAIAPDLGSLGRIRNKGAIETCFDYIDMYGGHTREESKKANEHVRLLIDRHGYDTLVRRLCKTLFLV